MKDGSGLEPAQLLKVERRFQCIFYFNDVEPQPVERF